jgi:hypothetical protein
MTFESLLNSNIEVLREYALIFSSELAAEVENKWTQFGDTNCVPSPVLLTNGKYMLCADILTEIQPGGLLHNMWINSNVATIVAGTEIVLLRDIIPLIPTSDIW